MRSVKCVIPKHAVSIIPQCYQQFNLRQPKYLKCLSGISNVVFVKDMEHFIAHVYFSERYQTVQCFSHLGFTAMIPHRQFKEYCKNRITT